MFRKILIPTDGSEASARAIGMGVTLAKEEGALVIGMHVMPDMPIYAYQAEILEDTFDHFYASTQSTADGILGVLKAAAAADGVKYEQICVRGSEPWRAILDAAHAQGCDLIVMASQGRKGIEKLVLGSETQKVLIHGKTPVLVVR